MVSQFTLLVVRFFAGFSLANPAHALGAELGFLAEATDCAKGSIVPCD